MADSILKLRVESSEYDAKLKKAAEGIRHLADVAHQGGGELTGLEKAELDYVKALGEMETKSRTAAGSVRELESTYKELKVIYDQLNDVEKADEGGKALAASLEQIKTRAQEARTQLENASKSLSDNGQEAQQSSGALDALASKFTINIDAIKLFNIGLQAAEGALDVAKDAFFNNEEQLDEWGRIVESSQSLYEGFLNALNTGDISGFLSNIGRIEQAARAAYDALDALGTYNAFNQINIERTRTGMTESIADFRGGKGTKEGVKAAGDAYKKELADRQRLENEAYVAAVKEMAAKRGANAKDLMDALSGTYGHYQDLKNVQPSGTRTRYIPGLPGQAGRYEEYKVAQNNQERLGEALRHLNDTELQSLQALGAQAQRTGTEIAQVDKQLTRVLNAKQPGTGGTGGKSTKTITEEKDDFKEVEEIVGLLNLQKQKLDDLQAMKPFAETEEEIVRLNKEIEKANTEYQRLLNLGKEKPIEIATGTSIQNNAGMSAYIASIKQQLETADYGTSLYNGLSAQLADMTTLQNLVGESLKAGLGTAMFDAADEMGKDFWTRAMEGGVDNIDWQAIVDKINEARKAVGLDAISIDFASGSVSTKAEKKKESPMEGGKKMLNAISQLTGGLQQMGIELPSEIQSVIGVIQGVMSVIEAVNTIIGVTQTTALTANTAAMISLEAALWANTATSFIPFANGGVVPTFANGGVIDSGHSPAFLSFSKAVPAFATGGVVPQTITSIPKFATGGIIQKFATGGTVEAGHAPDFLSFSKAMPKFTTGGTIPHANSGYFVGGTHFSGDVTPIMANAGELVLNKAQQGNLASQLQGGGMQNLNLTATIKGEQIRLALNNNGRRTGRGEYVQSSNNRV